jgi:poly-gamma-glutamate synthesis protein (capsule biosynthesis protein)
MQWILYILLSMSIPVFALELPGYNLLLLGDLMLGHRAWEYRVQEHLPPDYYFLGTRSVLDSSDFIFANLEGPISNYDTLFEKTYRFIAPPEVLLSLTSAPINGVNLANNHILDFGIGGIKETIENLEKFNILWVGFGENRKSAARPLITKISGFTVAFFGYSMTFP